MSFNLAPWNIEKLALVVEQLTEDGEQGWDVETPHASTVEHVQAHHAWLVALRRRNVGSAKELYARRRELFQYLEFGPDIEDQLCGLQVAAFLQVFEYLCRLDDAVEIWDPQARPAPDYPPNTTDEHESRKRLCLFGDPGGGYKQFSWHGRFTPGPGRIHFRIEAAPKRAILGYIGRKVGA